jgi:sugar lactone lactonase YvrE
MYWSEPQALASFLFHQHLINICCATSAVELPFTGLHFPAGITVDRDRNVYITDFDGNNPGRILKLERGAASAVQLPWLNPPFQLNHPGGVVVDSAGTLYVTTSDKVYSLGAKPTWPNRADNIYVTDILGKRVLKILTRRNATSR